MTTRLFASLLALATITSVACSSDPNEGENAPPPGPRTSPPEETGPGSTDIAFADGTAFEKRPCSVTLRFVSTASDVKVAGEFTDWDKSPIAMTKNGGAFEATIAPGPNAQAGKLYAYKLVVDGTWTIDPGAKYRKIVGGQMNSALVLPECAAAPETTAQPMEVSATGANAVVTARAADDFDPPAKIVASLDRSPVPAGSFEVKGADVAFRFQGLAKGKHTLSVRTFDKKGREAAPVDLPFWIEDEPFSYRDGILYMLLIDRFANGSTTNDRPIGNPVHYDADWHGGDLEGALAVLQSGYFEKLGVRTIWLSPTNQQTDAWHLGDGNQVYSAYHGYWPIKARAVEPRFGGDAALRAFVKEAHGRGLRVLLDLINNQVHKDHEYVAQQASWFRTACKCGDDAIGCGWSQRPFDCMFQPYLPDIDWNQGGAEKQFIADAVHWISEFDLDGFRVDAVKHVEANSVYNMRAELARRFEQGGARIFMVGETAVGEGDSGTFFGESFANGYAWIDAYTGPTALDGQFDFPTRHNMADGLVSGAKPMNEVEIELRKAETRYKPSAQHVRFLNGHDNPRIASIARGDPKLSCSWASGCRDDQLPPASYTEGYVYEKLRRALTVLYTLPGVPYLYQGDELAFPGGGDPDMRRDMRFAETELASLQMKKPGANVVALSGEQVALRDFVRKLGATRSASRALRRGTRKTLLGTDGDLWVYAYQTAPNELAIVAVNRGGAVTSRAIGSNGLDLSAASSFASPLGNGTLTKNGSDVVLTLGAGEAAIFVAQ